MFIFPHFDQTHTCIQRSQDEAGTYMTGNMSLLKVLPCDARCGVDSLKQEAAKAGNAHF